MVEQAQLEEVGSGVAPVSDGWFVVNAGESAWVRNDAFGARCTFESSPRILAERPDVEPRMFQEIGYTLAVLEPGKPSGLYHAESLQEDFFVLSGECVLLIEGEEHPLRAWDFVHCPAGTEHIFIGAGDGPCVLLMVGARAESRTIVYPRSDLALSHGAGVETETNAPREAYEPLPPWRLGRPDAWNALPWA
jgi:uncharacterized cupin superfamily protein